MTSSPLVSVLMTAYNREKYIAEAIDSVLQSTFKDFELIVVDDCSTDKTVEIIEGYVLKDSRVTLHVNEKNLGDYPNRNRAAVLAQGEYLKYVDSDDCIYPTGLQALVLAMSSYPEAGYGLCSFQHFRNQRFPYLLNPYEAYLQEYFKGTIFCTDPLSSIIRKSAWERVGGFSEEKMVSDVDMWNRLSREFSVVLMPGGVVYRRIHAEQEIADTKRYRARYYTKYDDVYFRAMQHPGCPLSEAEKKMVMRRLVKQNQKQLIKSALKLRFSDARVFFKNTQIYRAYTSCIDL